MSPFHCPFYMHSHLSSLRVVFEGYKKDQASVYVFLRERDRRLMSPYIPYRGGTLRVKIRVPDSTSTQDQCIRVGRWLTGTVDITSWDCYLVSSQNQNSFRWDCSTIPYQVTRSTYVVLLVSHCFTYHRCKGPLSIPKGPSVRFSFGGLDDIIEKGVYSKEITIKGQ